MSLSLPDFSVPIIQAADTEFEQFNQQTTTLAALSQHQAAGLVVYFYPKDNTAGCSVQAQDFSQYKTEFKNLGYRIIGVSRDSLKSHEKFITNHQINFPLISDSEQQLCEYFGVMGEKNLYGKKVLGVVRSTFVFDKNGKLRHECRNVRAKGHVVGLLEMLRHDG